MDKGETYFGLSEVLFHSEHHEFVRPAEEVMAGSTGACQNGIGEHLGNLCASGICLKAVVTVITEGIEEVKFMILHLLLSILTSISLGRSSRFIHS